MGVLRQLLFNKSPKSRGAKHITSHILRKVGGTCPPVHPMIDAHGFGRIYYLLVDVALAASSLHQALALALSQNI